MYFANVVIGLMRKIISSEQWHNFYLYIVYFVVSESFLQSLQSASSDKPKKCPMSRSETSFIEELMKAHGTNFAVC